MSWQQYVDTNLIGSKNLARAAIIGHDGNNWASSTPKLVSQTDGKALSDLFKKPNEALEKGIMLDGIKYMGIKANERSIYGKKGSTGLVCVKTLKSILVGYYNETQQPGNATNTIEKLADYLIENGF
ncbi:profilin II [Heterostelium album PN500]|uniref:Profilin n=1 Tax=Heterostelium pallidum (strain ATCC 26659 / Pp 5 / PN500) TaxID=670386 RepID=D3B642_HETP5|nr:profilin II [Heterostelium album PN500]EFA83340.1 profilin II [Heterostelium album PN500]|eukprot:XP_020435457.1 profilin II [Heterostelium album PN500]